MEDETDEQVERRFYHFWLRMGYGEEGARRAAREKVIELRPKGKFACQKNSGGSPMKTVDIKETNLDTCVLEAQSDRVVVTRGGKPVAIVVGVDELNAEHTQFGRQTTIPMIEGHVAQVVQEVADTATRFSDLAPGTRVHPVPFFGRVDKATVLTIGGNPSAEEFDGQRWPVDVDPAYLAGRLLHYFENSSVPPHPWFAAWRKALEPLGVSYEKGSVAHLDVSPRATIAMSKADPDGFIAMARHDVKWLFKLLELLNLPRLVLLAGCVTKKFYINKFLEKCAPQHGWQLLGDAQKAGPARVGFHALQKGSRTLACFSCSVSPSGTPPQRKLLAERVREHSQWLRRIVEG